MRRGQLSRMDGCKGLVLEKCEWVVKSAGEREKCNVTNASEC